MRRPRSRRASVGRCDRPPIAPVPPPDASSAGDSRAIVRSRAQRDLGAVGRGRSLPDAGRFGPHRYANMRQARVGSAWEDSGVWHPGIVEQCVFCGRPIGPDEPRVGRGESAAHAACADAALGDESFWDRIAASGMGGAAGQGPEAEPEIGSGADAGSPAGHDSRRPAANHGGCATLVGLLLLTAAVWFAGRPRWPDLGFRRPSD